MAITPPPVDILPNAGLLIGERWRRDSSGGQYQHIYPATGRPTLDVAMAGVDEIGQAVQCARKALPSWKRMSAGKRRDLLWRFSELLEKNAEDLARIGTVENGAALSKARLHFGAAVDQFRYIAGWADKTTGEVHQSWPVPAFDYVQYEPYGVVALIIPWNAPMHILGATLAPALAVGNTVVVKPSELAPYSSAKFGELLLEAGFPPGVINIAPATPLASEALVRHPGVDKVHFTGSGAVARKILAAAIENLTPVGLELGGKSARLVFADCDIDAAVQNAVSGATSISGQGCLLGTRIIVESSIYEEFVSRCSNLLSATILGDPLGSDTQMGPVVSAAACERILGVIKSAQSTKAGKLVTGGQRLNGDLAEGYFIQPTLFADVDNRGALAQTEIFGPVLATMPFQTQEEAIALANDTKFGLAAYVHTRDLKRAHQVASDLEAGNVWINGFCFCSTIPFGGVKQSGHGRTGGRQGLEEFSRTKNVWIAM
ncbi:MAG: aldehyde dehydrogenase [Burkholderiaceae bacterium]|nr:MAG: aldehyde dehydrogenase [Burkholderiaceae bacterium]TAM02119.1 MAG: aldehyde dehydrogenase [Pusillimonas sp.]